MTADRDALAELISREQEERHGPHLIADAILAAGWASPRDHRMEKILDAMGADEPDYELD